MSTPMTALKIHGVNGMLSTGHYTSRAKQPARQLWRSEGRPYPHYDRKGAKIHTVIRFDNELGNRRSSFSITAELSNVRASDEGSIGCAHDDIAKAFPELAHLIRWHLSDTAGPWGYPGNAIYLAGDRDSRGKRAGEPWAWHDAVRFGSVPMLHRIGKGLPAFLREIADYDPAGQEAQLVPIAVPYKGEDHKFSPKWQFAGQPPLKWHECPFDTEAEAEAFGASVLHGFTLERIPHLFSEGKARELDTARMSAVWPEATDEELMQEPEALRAQLDARLPGLLEAFRADIAAAGLAWPEV